MAKGDFSARPMVFERNTSKGSLGKNVADKRVAWQGLHCQGLHGQDKIKWP